MANLNITVARQMHFANMDDVAAFERGEISYDECERRYWHSILQNPKAKEIAVVTDVDHEHGAVTFNTIG